MTGGRAWSCSARKFRGFKSHYALCLYMLTFFQSNVQLLFRWELFFFFFFSFSFPFPFPFSLSFCLACSLASIRSILWCRYKISCVGIDEEVQQPIRDPCLYGIAEMMRGESLIDILARIDKYLTPPPSPPFFWKKGRWWWWWDFYF